MTALWECGDQPEFKEKIRQMAMSKTVMTAWWPEQEIQLTRKVPRIIAVMELYKKSYSEKNKTKETKLSVHFSDFVMASIYYVHVNLIKNYKLIWKKDTLNNYLEFASFFEYVVISWSMFTKFILNNNCW